MLERLDPKDRLRLVQFVCSFAWADLKVTPEEKDYVRRLVRRLHLPDAERREVEQCLVRPPAPESVDPNLIPYEHRELFIDTIHALIASDLELSQEEKDSARVLEQLLSGR